MTWEEGKELLQPFIDKCEKDTDPYFLIHFSRVQDKFSGVDSGLDSFDAMIIIKQLVKEFELNKSHLMGCLQIVSK